MILSPILHYGTPTPMGLKSNIFHDVFIIMLHYHNIFVSWFATMCKISCVFCQTLKKRQQEYHLCSYLLDECCEPSLLPISNQLAPLSHVLDRGHFSHNLVSTKFFLKSKRSKQVLFNLFSDNVNSLFYSIETVHTKYWKYPRNWFYLYFLNKSLTHLPHRTFRFELKNLWFNVNVVLT